MGRDVPAVLGDDGAAGEDDLVDLEVLVLEARRAHEAGIGTLEVARGSETMLVVMAGRDVVEAECSWGRGVAAVLATGPAAVVGEPAGDFDATRAADGAGEHAPPPFQWS